MSLPARIRSGGRLSRHLRPCRRFPDDRPAEPLDPRGLPRADGVLMTAGRRLRIPSTLSRAFILHSVNVVRYTWAHPANRGGRIQALARLARFQVRGRLLGRRTAARLGRHSKLWAYLHRWATLKVVCANPPDHPEMLVWQQVLRPGDLFVDVGANVGSYTIWAGDLGAHVIALEPAADTFALLKENVALNGYPVDMIQAAAGAECGTAHFTSGRDDCNRLDAAGRTEIVLVTMDSVLEDRPWPE